MKKIVVVGAGASARVFCKTLSTKKSSAQDSFHVTVVQPNSFASLPYYETLVLTERETLVGNSTFQPIDGADETVYGVAVACTDGALSVRTLEGSSTKEVPFDILVCATGSALPVVCATPGQSQTERQSEIDAVQKLLLSGKNVVIGGGGAVGVELAGDVLEMRQKKGTAGSGTVTLVSSSSTLLPDQPSHYGERAKDVLEQLGCKIVLEDRVVSHSDSVLETVELVLKSGTKLSCDAYVAAYSRGASTSWLTTAPASSAALKSSMVDPKGQVIVDDYLQSTVYDKLFALGATNNRKEIALGMNCEAQAKTVVANILKPKSTPVPSGLEHAVYQIVGHDTAAFFMPENLPMPAFCSTLCCQWCGFPFNILCPCWCCAVVCGPADPLTCGYCCGPPDHPGLARTMNKLKDLGAMASSMQYVNVGKEVMDR